MSAIDILSDAQDILRLHGLCKGVLRDSSSGSYGALGALDLAYRLRATAGVEEGSAGLYESERASSVVAISIMGGNGGDDYPILARYNDLPDTTLCDVIALFEKAKKKLSTEHSEVG